MDDEFKNSCFGFNYTAAIEELLARMTLTQLVQAIGYKSVGSVYDITKKGRIPSHIHGEALWALYHDTFGRKPPMTEAQRVGRLTVRQNA